MGASPHRLLKKLNISIDYENDLILLKKILNKFNEKSLSLRSAHTINGRVGQSLKNVMDPLIIISGISMVFFFIEIISMTPGEAIVLLALIFRLLQSAQLSFSDYQKKNLIYWIKEK